MGYDYSLEFLHRHPKDVEMIETCYRTRQKFFMVYDHPTDATRGRININNVLRSLAMYYPEQYANVRKAIRTSIDRDAEGKWILTVYTSVPGEVIAGRPPGQDTKNTWIGSAYTPRTDTEYQHPDLIRDEDTYTDFIHKVLALAPEVKKVQADFLQDIDAQIIAQDPTFEGWIPHLNGPTTLILERP